MLKVAQSANVAVRQMRTDNFDQGEGYAYLPATCADVLAGLVTERRFLQHRRATI